MTRDRVAAEDVLRGLWGAEYDGLTIPQQMAVLADYMDDDAAYDDIVRMIGRGNLASYANVTLVGLIRRAHGTPIGQQWRGDESDQGDDIAAVRARCARLQAVADDMYVQIVHVPRGTIPNVDRALDAYERLAAEARPT